MDTLAVNNLTISHGNQHLVKNISFSIAQGEWFALVGESGSGKSITALSIGAILPSALHVTGGAIAFKENSLNRMNPAALSSIRGKELSYIFQDYLGTFTPFIPLGKQGHEMLRCHGEANKNKRREMILSAYEGVGLEAQRVYDSYPVQLSGGQLQRVAIAMATLFKPSLLIADEPTTALDGITAGKVLDLIAELQHQTNCAVLFITHDLRCVRRYADHIAIMHNGNIVEKGTKTEIFKNPKHPYTRYLFSSVPPLRNVPERLPCAGEQSFSTEGGLAG